MSAKVAQIYNTDVYFQYVMTIHGEWNVKLSVCVKIQEKYATKPMDIVTVAADNTTSDLDASNVSGIIV